MAKQSKTFYVLRILVAVLIIIGGGLWLVKTQQTALEKVLKVLPKFSLNCIVLVIFLDCLQIFFMSLRFWLLYPKNHRTRARNVFAAMSIGQTMNAFLPARAGDFYKIATLAPKPPVPDFNMLTLTGILTADKMVDLVSFLVLVFAFGSYKENPDSLSSLKSFNWKYILLAIVIFGAGWQFFLKKQIGKLAVWITQFLKGLKSLLSPGQLFLALMMAVFVWLVEASALVQLSQYQGYSLSIAQSFFVLTVLNLAIAVPISVANIGPFEASIAFALGKFGMPLEVALAIATVHHGLQVIAYMISGAIGWILRKKTFNPS